MRILEGRTALGDDVDVENVLAITFTKKAAREMRERVAKGLVGRRSENAQELEERLQDAYIHTFHAFCTRILRSYAFEAGLSPDFAVAEELEGARLLERAALDTLRARLDRDDADLMRLLRGPSLHRTAWAYRQAGGVSSWDSGCAGGRGRRARAPA